MTTFASTAPDTKFFDDAYLNLSAQAYIVDDSSKKLNDIVGVKRFKRDFDERMSRLICDSRANDRENYDGNVRFLTALVNGLENGKIVLDTTDDLVLFAELFTSANMRHPQVVEYYIETGDLVSLMHMLSINPEPESFFKLNADKLMPIKLIQLYNYETSALEEHLSVGDDPKELIDLGAEKKVETAGLRDVVIDMFALSTIGDIIPERDHREIFAHYDYSMNQG